MMDMNAFFEELNSIDQQDNSLLLDFCRKQVIHGTPYIFQQKEHEYYEFRKRISNKWNIMYHDVHITGSAKLGFSFIKQKQFDLDSDIDVAIISNPLFDEFMALISDFQWSIRNKNITLTFNEAKEYHLFLEYTAIGWLRPDKLPLSISVDRQILKKDWFSFFQSISNNNSEVGNYQVTAGIFKNYQSFETYTLDSLIKGKTNAKNNSFCNESHNS